MVHCQKRVSLSLSQEHTKKLFDGIMNQIDDFHRKKNALYMPLAYGCDLHLADEVIKNTYHQFDNKLPEQVRTLYIRLMEDESWLTRDDVVEMRDYFNKWLESND